MSRSSLTAFAASIARATYDARARDGPFKRGLDLREVVDGLHPEFPEEFPVLLHSQVSRKGLWRWRRAGRPVAGVHPQSGRKTIGQPVDVLGCVFAVHYLPIKEN